MRADAATAVYGHARSRRASAPARTAIDLFCGCGGMTIGLQQACFVVVGAVEINALAACTYRLNHALVHLWHNDMRNVSGATVRRTLKLRKGELNLLARCSPHQGFSTLRTLNGESVDDPRNDMVFEFLRFVEELRPKALLMENVPDLPRDHRLMQVLAGLDALGYHCDHAIIDAALYVIERRSARINDMIRHVPKNACSPHRFVAGAGIESVL